jgi:hypothetical protein
MAWEMLLFLGILCLWGKAVKKQLLCLTFLLLLGLPLACANRIFNSPVSPVSVPTPTPTPAWSYPSSPNIPTPTPTP